MGRWVVTRGSTIKCSKINGTVGRIGLNSKLYVGSDPVTVVGDLLGAPISECTQPTNNAGDVGPCVIVTTRDGGTASKLFVGTSAVILDDVGGTTNGKSAVPPPPTADPDDPPPPGADVTISVISVGQSKLKAE